MPHPRAARRRPKGPSARAGPRHADPTRAAIDASGVETTAASAVESVVRQAALGHRPVGEADRDGARAGEGREETAAIGGNASGDASTAARATEAAASADESREETAAGDGASAA